MGAIKSLVGQTAIYGLSSIVGRFLNYLLVPLYTNIFSPAEYGVVTELYAYSSFLLIIFTYGMETAFFRFAQENKKVHEVYSTTFMSILSSSLFFLMLFSLLIPWLSHVMHYEHQKYLLWLLLLILITDSIAAIPFAYLRQQNKAWKFVFVRITNIGLNILANILFLIVFPYLTAKGFHLWGLYDSSIGVGYVFIANLIANVITCLLLIPYFRFTFFVDLHLLKQMISYSLPLLVAGLAGMVNETFDRILIKYLINDETTAMHQLGIYGANYKISILMTLFIQTFRFAAEPFFFNHAKEQNAKELYARVMKYFIILGLMIFLLVVLFLHYIQFFIGKEFREGLMIVPILLMANLFLGVFFNLSVWYKLTNKTIFGAYLAVIGAIITIVLNWILIPVMGYVGAAWTTLLCYAIMTLLSFLWGKRYYPVPYPLKTIFAYMIFAVLIFIFAQWLSIENVWLKNLIHMALLGLFASVIFFNEKQELKSIIH
ncbi:MAG: oligosaccharide flippase family protein [Bacteroidales bacterium]|nr:oligosaccharide flippase family protein [Bacteroidales bacterium]